MGYSTLHWPGRFSPYPNEGLEERINMNIVHTARQEAQGLVEYGLIIALVAVLAIAGLIIFGPAVSALLSRLGGSV